MRNINAGNITQAVNRTWDQTPDARLKYLLQTLETRLHDYIREVKLTHEEWLQALGFLWSAGQISDANRNEFSLLSDILGVTSLVDLLNATPGATIGSVLGPFYTEDSPYLPVGGDLVKDNEGDTVLLTGIVRDTQGGPLPDASIDLWQTNALGAYATQDPAQDDENLRCRQDCDKTGRYALTTILPTPYTIPMDGPVGALFRRAGRTPWRPAHFHFIVRAPGHRPIVTEIFFQHDKLVDSDAVFGVREPLVREIRPFRRNDFADVPAAREPQYVLSFDFTLLPETQLAVASA